MLYYRRPGEKHFSVCSRGTGVIHVIHVSQGGWAPLMRAVESDQMVNCIYGSKKNEMLHYNN